jgi:RNA recognition motif-containing protein
MTPQALQLSRHARRVYVGNLPQNTTESSLTHYFNQVRHSSSCAGGGRLYVLYACWAASCVITISRLSVWKSAQLQLGTPILFWACHRKAMLISWCVCMQVMMAVGACSSPGVPVIGCYLNPDKRFAFVEFRNVEEASNAMAFDGVGCQVGAGYAVWVSNQGDSAVCQSHFTASHLTGNWQAL